MTKIDKIFFQPESGGNKNNNNNIPTEGAYMNCSIFGQQSDVSAISLSSKESTPTNIMQPLKDTSMNCVFGLRSKDSSEESIPTNIMQPLKDTSMNCVFGLRYEDSSVSTNSDKTELTKTEKTLRKRK